MSDIPEGELDLAGTFSLNGHPIVILFDTRATHDFISKECTQRHQLAIEPTNTPYVISTPRGRVVTKQLVMYTPLNLTGKLFRTSLIVLDGQGTDVILGMNLKALLAPLVAAFDALLRAMSGDVRWCLLVTAWGHLPACLCGVEHDCLIAGGVQVGDAMRLLELASEEVALSTFVTGSAHGVRAACLGYPCELGGEPRVCHSVPTIAIAKPVTRCQLG
jgi:hypothetical protein